MSITNSYGILVLIGDVMKVYVEEKEICIKKYQNFFQKAIGLMGKKEIKEGIVLVHCNSIHTFFMKEAIDVVMTDKNYKVLYVYKELKKNKIILPKKNVYYTFELPKKSIKNLKRNTYIKTED